ncbi:hypothetical protein N0V82_003352 [Gnomoniopsis sp. IMI 355080]|nr:hypothetical protein N0V82_003352 [Gnomoniopsis sp. IMI 355080]
MTQQNHFSEHLARILTPLTIRGANKDDGDLQVDTSGWYNTPGVAVAAATSSATSGENVNQAQWGARELPGGPGPDANTLFQACSISKPFQSLAILHYISEGVISGLDDPVKLYLAEESYRTLLHNSIQKGIPEELAAQLLDKTTILQLLSHTAGSTASGFQGYATSSAHIPSTTEVLKGASGNANSPSVYVNTIPGIQVDYSGGGTTVLQAMLENVGSDRGSFTSFAALMKTLVLEPLGMTRSFYCNATALPQSESNYATGYHNGSHGLESGQYHIHPEQGAAGLWTTPMDLTKGMVGFAHSLLGTSSAIRLNGKPWIRPEVAQELLYKRRELGHGQNAYYCGFSVQFFDGEDDLLRDQNLVQISHAGANYGYRFLTTATFVHPDKLVESVEDTIISAQSIMTNSNYGGEIIGPLMFAISEFLDRPSGPGARGTAFEDYVPASALDTTASIPAAGWEAYEGRWNIENRSQTLHITTSPEPTLEFSHLDGIRLPLLAVAERKGEESMRLRAGSLEVMLDFGWQQKKNEACLTLCTGGSRVKCIKKSP